MEKRFLSPAETTEQIVANGLRVNSQPLARTIVLSLLAGFYIAFGAQLTTVVTQDAAPFVGYGITRLLGGSVFSLGLMLVVICGAELFTGNSLLTKTVLDRQLSWGKMGKNWGVVLLGNFVGSLFFAWLMYRSDLWRSGTIADHAVAIASAKCQLSFEVALIRGILCNWLVCLAIFMAVAARDIGGKMLACYVPIMAFVASGFEHSVANMYLIPTGLLLKKHSGIIAPELTWNNFFFGNLLPVTLGNIVGGVVFVSCAYWFIHLRNQRTTR
ncbi:MAG: formate/nitrite transporter family protein [Desulfuromonadales bacterium]|nr:formate/nitrite transporter family protein [Desulfuromonadales bacterium]MDT8422359.1 formate/nitrite transporter family protein [Desulfuromonadales bacterium]